LAATVQKVKVDGLNDLNINYPEKQKQSNSYKQYWKETCSFTCS
jgi:hypothetical protein